MQPSLRLGLARWLIAVPALSGCFLPGSCPITGQQIVALDDPRLTTRESADAGADGGVPVFTSVTADNCMQICAAALSNGGFMITGCSATQTDGGAPAAECDTSQLCEGRAPAGLAARHAAPTDDELGAHFARMAHFEAASVYAFAILGVELRAHDAPAGLRRAVRRAAGDEVRHAHASARRAVARGARPEAPRVQAPHGPRELEDVLTENATEGCVRETWGAVLAHRQALAAREPDVRALYAAIARDELFHAEISRAVARWGEARLGRAARARVRDARRATADALLAGAFGEATSAAARAALGLPDPSDGRAIARRMQRDLWTT